MPIVTVKISSLDDAISNLFLGSDSGRRRSIAKLRMAMSDSAFAALPSGRR